MEEKVEAERMKKKKTRRRATVDGGEMRDEKRSETKIVADGRRRRPNAADGAGRRARGPCRRVRPALRRIGLDAAKGRTEMRAMRRNYPIEERIVRPPTRRDATSIPSAKL